MTEERTKSLEHRADAVERRLDAGAETLARVRETMVAIQTEAKSSHDHVGRIEAQLPRLVADEVARTLRPKSMWSIFTALSAGAVFTGTLIWYAAKYPDRNEVDAIDREGKAALKEVSDRVHRIERAQDSLRTEVQIVKESVERSEALFEDMHKKIDRIDRRRR